MKPLIIDNINRKKDTKKKMDTIIEVIKLGELIPIIPKIGQSGATIRNII
jgi:hypothetical protein